MTQSSHKRFVFGCGKRQCSVFALWTKTNLGSNWRHDGSKAALQSAPGQKSHISEINFHTTNKTFCCRQLPLVFPYPTSRWRFRNLLQSHHLQIPHIASHANKSVHHAISEIFRLDGKRGNYKDIFTHLHSCKTHTLGGFFCFPWNKHLLEAVLAVLIFLLIIRKSDTAGNTDPVNVE